MIATGKTFLAFACAAFLWINKGSSHGSTELTASNFATAAAAKKSPVAEKSPLEATTRPTAETPSLLTAAAAVVAAWRGLGWRRVLVIGDSRQDGPDLLKRSSASSVAIRLMEKTTVTNMSYSGDYFLTLFNLDQITVNLVKDLILLNEWPPYKVMLVLCQNDEKKWISLKKWLSPLQMTRGFFILKYGKNSFELTKIQLLLNYDSLLEMKMEQNGLFFSTDFNMKGILLSETLKRYL